MADQNQPGAGSPQASRLAEEAQGLAAKLADTAQEQARGVLSTAEEKARDFAEAKKREAAAQVEGVAGLVDSVAEQVGNAVPPAGPYVRGVAEEIHRVSSTLRDTSLDEIMDEARRFAQARPGLVLGGAVVLGFGLARFLKATADRRADRHMGEPSGAHARPGQRAQGRAAEASGARLAGSSGTAAGAGAGRSAAMEGGRSDGR